MGWFNRLASRLAPATSSLPAAPAPAERLEPRVSYQEAGGGTIVRTPQDLEEALRSGLVSAAGALVTPATAMKVAAVYACVRLLSGAVANMPLDLMRRVDDRVRMPAHEHSLWKVLKRRPNRWQTPSQFRRMMEAHKQLRGNGYAQIVWSRGRVLELIPMHPDRVEVHQLDDLALEYIYTRPNGSKVKFAQREIFHLVGMTLDGVRGVSPITYARETIGASLAMEEHGANVFRNGAQIGNVFKMPAGKSLSDPAYDRLKASLEAYQSNGDRAGGTLLLEEGMDIGKLAMLSTDAQFIENKRLTRSDVAMFFGVPPHMIGDTEKTTSWGSGIESQTQGFVAFTLEDHLTTWEETINRDCLNEEEATIYARFNRAALVKGDLKTRYDAYLKGRQMKMLSANDVRAAEDMNPVDGGDVYENPMITVKPEKEESDEPSNPA